MTFIIKYKLNFIKLLNIHILYIKLEEVDVRWPCRRQLKLETALKIKENTRFRYLEPAL